MRTKEEKPKAINISEIVLLEPKEFVAENVFATLSGDMVSLIFGSVIDIPNPKGKFTRNMKFLVVKIDKHLLSTLLYLCKELGVKPLKKTTEKKSEKQLSYIG